MSKSPNLDQVRDRILSLPDENVNRPNMRIGDYAQKAESIALQASKDKEALVNKGITPMLIDELPVYISAARESEALWTNDRNISSDATKLWKKKYPIACELKQELLENFDYAYRKDEEAKTTLRDIREGTGRTDLVQDLLSLSVLGKNRPAALQSTNFEMQMLDTAATLSEEMADLLAVVTGDRLEKDPVMDLRNRAYSFLKETLDEVIACGRCVFYKDAERLKIYRSPYSY